MVPAEEYFDYSLTLPLATGSVPQTNGILINFGFLEVQTSKSEHANVLKWERKHG